MGRPTGATPGAAAVFSPPAVLAPTIGWTWHSLLLLRDRKASGLVPRRLRPLMWELARAWNSESRSSPTSAATSLAFGFIRAQAILARMLAICGAEIGRAH